MTVAAIIRDWLLLVGDQYGVREAHQDRRRSDQCKTRAPYFIWRFTGSESPASTAQDVSEANGDRDVDIEHYKTFSRTLEIECHTPMVDTVAGDIDGMRVLEAVSVSIHNPAVSDILNRESANRMVIDDTLPVTNITEQGESFITRAYQMQVRCRINTHFKLLRENHQVVDYTLTGELLTE